MLLLALTCPTPSISLALPLSPRPCSGALRLAAARPYTQVIFGLRQRERLVASSACALGAACLSSATPSLVYGPQALQPGLALAGVLSGAQPAGASASGLGVLLGMGAAGRGATAEGGLYVTSRSIGFTTLLAGDVRGVTDVTLRLPQRELSVVRRGDAPDTLLVQTHGTYGGAVRYGRTVPRGVQYGGSLPATARAFFACVGQQGGGATTTPSFAHAVRAASGKRQA